VTGHISRGFRSAAFLTITTIIPAGGCGHRSPKPQHGTTASYEELHPLIGKQVAIRGEFSLLGKFGPYVLFGKQQVVYLVHWGSFTWEKPHSEMDGKLVAATGILSFSHSPAPPNQQTQLWPELLITITSRRRPFNCGLLAVELIRTSWQWNA
jgi:hypothetical protein